MGTVTPATQCGMGASAQRCGDYWFGCDALFRQCARPRTWLIPGGICIYCAPCVPGATARPWAQPWCYVAALLAALSMGCGWWRYSVQLRPCSARGIFQRRPTRWITLEPLVREPASPPREHFVGEGVGLVAQHGRRPIVMMGLLLNFLHRYQGLNTLAVLLRPSL